MSEDATTLGSEADSGNPGEVNGAGDNGLPPESGAFLDALSGDNRQLAESRKLDTPDKIFDSYRELTSKLGSTLNPPGEDATDEEWGKFYDRLGRPEKADGYEFNMPEDLNEDFAYDEDSANLFKEWAFDAGLTPRQSQQIHDRFVQWQNDSFVGSTELQQEAIDTAHKAIVKEWGEPKTPLYQRNQELANRAIRELGGEELESAFKASGVMNDKGSVLNPSLAFAMAKVGQELYAEDNIFSAQARERNPFASDTENVTEQGRMLRNDPELAKDLIRAAGREKDFPTVMSRA